MDLTIEAGLTYSDFPDICRFCLKFGKVIQLSKRSIINTFHKITNLTIQTNDLLPQNVCDECIEKLDMITDFIEMCQYNHDFLTNIAISEQDKQLLQEMISIEEPNESIILDIVPDESNEYCVYKDEDICWGNNDTFFNSKVDEQFLIKTKNAREVITELDNTNEKLNKGILENNRIFKCKKCKKKFHALKLFKLHLFTHVDVNDKTDQNCYERKIYNKKFSHHTSLKNHKNLHHASEVIGDEATDRRERNDKLMKVLGNYISRTAKIGKKWKCIECNKFFGRRYDLQRHLCIHVGVKPHACTLCPLAFIARASLNRHIKVVHTEKVKNYLYECYICERKFCRKNNIKIHVAKTHVQKIDEDDFYNPSQKSCDLCGKTFSTYSYTKQHAVAHMEIKPKPPCKRKPNGIKRFLYPTSSKLCSFCGKSFNKQSSLYVHISRNHRSPNAPKMQTKPKNENVKSKKVFQCWQCGQILTTSSNLKVHMRNHTGEKPFECKFCHRKFSAWGSWQEHENIHTGFKPFQCELCKKGFKHRASLRKHVNSGVHPKTEKKAVL